MKIKLVLLSTLLLFCIDIIAQPTMTWAKRMGAGSGSASDQGLSLAVDASGNTYSTGYFEGTVDFDPGAGSYILTAGSTIGDIYISKLDPSGNFIWAKQIGGNSASESYVYSIALDASGNVYTTGYFNGTVDFDPGVGTFNLTCAGGGKDIFISKIDALGSFVWAKQIGGTLQDEGRSIILDGSGNVCITGGFQGTVDFDPNAGIVNLTSMGSFVLKLDGSGNLVWAKTLGVTSNSIAVDASGNVHTTGCFTGTQDFDPNGGVSNLTSAGSSDVFVSKLDVSGNFVWAKRMGGAGLENGQGIGSIALDATGNVYTTGYFGGPSADFDPGVGIFNLFGNQDAFISKLDVLGNFVWANSFEGNGIGHSIALDGSGNIYTTGKFGCTSGTCTVDFDPGASVFNLTASTNSVDVFVSKLNNSGNFIWAVQFNGGGNEYANDIAVDASNNVYTTGVFFSTVDFDPGAGMFNLTSAGNDDIFVHKMLGCSLPTTPGTISGTATICAGTTNTYSITAVAGATSYTWTLPSGWTGTSTTNSINATASTTSGNITVIANNACGNSTAQTLAVVVNTIPSTPGTISGTATICSGTTNTYSITAVAGATSYTWTLPGGWTGTSSTNSITATASVTSGNITVTANNVCGNSSPQTLAVVVNTIPTTPGTISGLASMCIGTGAQTYSITAVGGATSYTWTLPATWSGTSTTNSIVATPGTSSGNITVTANNTCGNSSPQTLAVIINPLPVVTYSQSPSLVCINATSVALGTVSPSGGTFAGTSVTGSTFNASTAGNGTFNITYTYTDGNGCVNSANSNIVVDPCTGVSQNSIDNGIMIYPNPTNNFVTITGVEDNATIEVYNVLGKIVLSQQITKDKTEIDLGKETSGIYFMKISNNKETITKRIIKN